MSTLVDTRTIRQTRKPRVALRLGLVALLLGLVAAGVIGFHLFKAHMLRGVVAGILAELPTVATTTAAAQTWQPQLAGNGTLRASRGVDLSAELSGIVSELRFESGEVVDAGAPLLRLRPNDDEAKLAQLQATAELNAITYERDLKQLRAQGVAQSTVDTDVGNLKAARAQVAAQQAIIAQKLVRAPFAGRLGLRQVDLGQYLSPGTKIVTLQALDPMFLDFYLPQQSIGAARVGQDVTVRLDAYKGRDFAGKISAINPQVDAASRMVQLRATLANADQALLPGMFATVAIAAGTPVQAVVVPLTAITANPYGSLAYVVRQDGTDDSGKPKLVAKQVFVVVGESRGDQVQVLKGIAVGDSVVTAGQLKLHDGAAVAVNNDVQPSNDPHPQPTDR